MKELVLQIKLSLELWCQPKPLIDSLPTSNAKRKSKGSLEKFDVNISTAQTSQQSPRYILKVETGYDLQKEKSLKNDYSLILDGDENDYDEYKEYDGSIADQYSKVEDSAIGIRLVNNFTQNTSNQFPLSIDNTNSFSRTSKLHKKGEIQSLKVQKVALSHNRQHSNESKATSEISSGYQSPTASASSREGAASNRRVLIESKARPPLSPKASQLNNMNRLKIVKEKNNYSNVDLVENLNNGETSITKIDEMIEETTFIGSSLILPLRSPMSGGRRKDRGDGGSRSHHKGHRRQQRLMADEGSKTWIYHALMSVTTRLQKEHQVPIIVHI
jgi:hypothetical protein